jgi:hypothetical protein
MDNDFYAPATATPDASSYVAPVQVVRPKPLRRGWHTGLVVVVIAGTVLGMIALGFSMMRTVADSSAKTVDRVSEALDLRVQSDLIVFAQREEEHFADHGEYAGAQRSPGSVTSVASGTKITATYGDSTFCLQGTRLGTKNVWFYSSERGLLPQGETCT